jgi:transcriptional regulator with XRE-family HTH domain
MINSDILIPQDSDRPEFAMLGRLSPEERVLLKDLKEKTQKQVARELNMTQGAISARVSKINKKLRFMFEVGAIDTAHLEEDLSKFFTRLGVDIIKFMTATTSQSRTADLVNEKYGLKYDPEKMTQLKIKDRFEKCLGELQNLEKNFPELKKYSLLLALIKANLYMFQKWRKNGIEISNGGNV